MGENVICGVLAGILIFFLFVFIFSNCLWTERFTAPGLTLTVPPSWFPQNAAKGYNPQDWMSKMYLDKYPFWVSNKGNKSEYMSYDESNKLASTNRFWKI